MYSLLFAFFFINLNSHKNAQQKFVNFIDYFSYYKYYYVNYLMLNDYCDFLMTTVYAFIHITTAMKLDFLN